jgi:hypothetical protein
MKRLNKVRVLEVMHSLIFMFLCIMTQYTKMTNKWQLCRIIYYSLAALHVLSDIFTQHQEHLNCITTSGIIHMCHCQLVSWECCSNTKKQQEEEETCSDFLWENVIIISISDI